MDLSRVKKETHGNCRCKEAQSESSAVTCLCLPAGTAVTCSVPAAATRRSQYQASNCSSPAASVRPATATSSSARPPWTWSWTNPSRRAPTELQRSRTGEGRGVELSPPATDTGALLKKSTGASQNVPWTLCVCVLQIRSLMCIYRGGRVGVMLCMVGVWEETTHSPHGGFVVVTGLLSKARGVRMDILVPWTRQAEEVVSLCCWSLCGASVHWIIPAPPPPIHALRTITSQLHWRVKIRSYSPSALQMSIDKWSVHPNDRISSFTSSI